MAGRHLHGIACPCRLCALGLEGEVACMLIKDMMHQSLSVLNALLRSCGSRKWPEHAKDPDGCMIWVACPPTPYMRGHDGGA
jgi:hypothetical protein